MTLTLSSSPVVAAMGRIAVDIAAAEARRVDREACFPTETIQALRSQGLLAAVVPEEMGGLGANIAEIVAMTALLAEHCGSSAMLFAMHNSQLACIVDHASGQPYFAKFLSGCASKGLLLASATSEQGSGGDIFTSNAPLEQCEEQCVLRKECTVISYGRFADAVLVTMRRSPGSPASDQVLAVLEREQIELQQRGSWDALGMRGTCSEPFALKAEFHSRQIFDCDARGVLRKTMVPVSHILWAAVWVGIARGAVARATAFLQTRARSSGNTASSAGSRLARAAGNLWLLEGAVGAAAREQGFLRGNAANADRYIETTLASNNLKLSSSTLASEICLECLLVCGLAGYQEDSPFSVARAVRDVLSGALMINNDRIAEVNGAYLSL